MDNQDEGIPSTTIRELSLLQEFHHPNIVELLDAICEEKQIMLIFELWKMDLKTLIYPKYKDRGIPLKTVKKLMYQLISAIEYWHSNRKILINHSNNFILGTFHRDLKPNNILIDNENNVKLADFGLARAFSFPMKDYTHEVVTLWYRAPEILLGDSNYSTPIDIWALGVIFYEIAHGKTFFYELSEIGVLFRIFSLFGTPTNESWPDVESLKFYKKKFPKFKPESRDPDLFRFDEVMKDLFFKMIEINPVNRISASLALKHEYFKDYE